MTFNGVLDVVDQSKTISEVGDLFVENPVDVNGQSLTVMNTPLYKGLNGTLGKNFALKRKPLLAMIVLSTVQLHSSFLMILV